jgi:3-oxoacyl-(acyl-carrier-protein) synthase
MRPVVVCEVQERHPHLRPQGIPLQPLGWQTDPNGWDAGRYRIPTDISLRRIGPLLALVCTAEPLSMSGIIDPYELYNLNHSHPPEAGTRIGSGMGGGTESLAKSMFKDHWEEKKVQNDILQET